MMYYKQKGQPIRRIVDNDHGDRLTAKDGVRTKGEVRERDGSIEASMEDTKREHEIIIVYWTDGKPGSVFEAMWTGGQDQPDSTTYDTISGGTWAKDWTATAYQASCYHWLSDETEGQDIPETKSVTEQPDMWIESTHAQVCTHALKHTPCTKKEDLYYFPRSALRCGRPSPGR
jgi:hypothetical protein